jgi:hypothetical protein
VGNLTIDYFRYALGAVLVLYVFGLGLTLWLLPDRLQKYVLIIAPSVGFAYLSLAAWHVYYFGGKLGVSTAAFLLLLALVPLVLFVLTNGFSAIWRALRFWPGVVALVCATASFIFLSWPLLANPWGLTTISLGNLDVTHYAAMTRFVSEFGRFSNEGFVGQLQGGTHFVRHGDTYFGVYALSALEGAIFGLMPHQNTTLCIFILLAYSGAVVFLISYESFQLPALASCVSVIWLGLHPVMHFVAAHGFFGQLAGGCFAIMIFWNSATLTSKALTRPEALKLWILLVLFTAGMVLNYPHMLPFVWFFGAIYFAVVTWSGYCPQAFKRYIFFNAAAILATGLLCFQRIVPFLELFRVYGSIQAGWFIQWLSPNCLMGLLYKSQLIHSGVWQITDWRVTDWRVTLTLSVAAAIIVGTILLRAWQARKFPLIAIVAAGATIYFGCLCLAIYGQENGMLGGYKSFKLLSFFVPFFAPAVAAFFGCQLVSSKRIDIAIKAVTLAVLAISYYNAALGVNAGFKQGDFRAEPAYNALLTIDRDKSVDSLNMFGKNGWRTMWEVYFLMHKKLYMQKNSGYYPPSELEGTYDLLDKLTEAEEIVHVTPNHRSNLRRVSERFTVSMPQDRVITAELGSGWHSNEPRHVWSGLGGRDASIIVHSATGPCSIRLTLKCSPLQPKDDLQVRYGDKLLPVRETAEGGFRKIETPPFELHRGDNTVTLTARLDPVRPNSPDPRKLSFSFAAIDIEAVGCVDLL